MPKVLVKSVALLLLIMQGLVSFASGQVLCIPLVDCGMHHKVGCGEHGRFHSHECAAEVGAHECHDHQHDPLRVSIHAHDECGCHLHVPVPSSKELPSSPRGDNFDLRLAVVPLCFAFVMTRAFEPPREVTHPFKPPDFSTSDQVLALKTARLII